MKDVTEVLSKKDLYDVAKMLEVKIPSKAPKPMIVDLINSRISELNEGYMQPVVNPLGDNGLGSAIEESVVDSGVGAASVEPIETPTISASMILPSRMADAIELASINRGVHPITGEPV